MIAAGLFTFAFVALIGFLPTLMRRLGQFILRRLKRIVKENAQ